MKLCKLNLWEIKEVWDLGSPQALLAVCKETATTESNIKKKKLEF